MYVTAADLRVIRREGVLTRFAVLGPVAYVLADMAQGASGTSLEASCVERHWAIVLRGTLELERVDLTALPAGTAFHVPAGEPHHRFHGSDAVVVAGFAPLASTQDLRDETHSATGSEVLRTMHRPPPLPATIRLARPGITYRAGHGAIEVETATMGPWIFSRATFGPLSGYTSSWCDLPHWGLVVQGDLAIAYEHEVELLTAGDAYYCPAGPPGHRFEVPDAAMIMDHTPVDGIERGRRRAEWRRLPARAVGLRSGGGGETPGDEGVTEIPDEGPRKRPSEAPVPALAHGTRPPRVASAKVRAGGSPWVG